MTETVTKQSWGSRLGSSIKGIFTGIIMVVAAIVLLFWNEGRAVSRAKALSEGKSNVISVEPSSIDSANEGKLVHVTGDLVTTDILQDPFFGISENAIRLERTVEIYQWDESSSSKTEKKLGGGTQTVTTYSYSKKWCREPVNSENFHDENARRQYVNIGVLPYQNESMLATNVTLGAFRFSEELIRSISGSEDYRFAPDAKLPESLGPNARIEGSYVILPYNVAPQQNVVSQTLNAVANEVQNQATAQKAAQAATPAPAAAPAQAAAPAPAAPAQAAAPAPAAPVVQKSPVALAPQVGDVRVRFRIIRPHKISIAAAQKGDTFTSYIASNDEKVLLMVNGEKSAAEMFTSAEKSNAIWTWVLRLVGFLLMKAGFGTILHPLSVLADVVPFIGNIVEVGTGLISALFAFPLSLVVIAVAWLFYRPLLAIVLLAIVIGCVVLLVMKLKAKKAPVPAPAA